MPQKDEAKQRADIAHAEYLGQQSGGERHGAQPEEAHRRGERIEAPRTQRQQHEQRHGAAARQVEAGQQVLPAVPAAQQAAPVDAGDVSQGDDRQRSHAIADLHALIEQVGRQVGGDECQLEAAGEEAEIQQPESRMVESLADGLAHWHFHGARSPLLLLLRGLPQRERQRQRECHQHRQHHQRAAPAHAADHLLRRRHHGELAEPADRTRHAKRPAAPVLRHQSAERTVDHAESRARQGDADAYPGAQDERHGGSRMGHAEQAQRVEQQAAEHHPGRTEAVGEHAAEWLDDTPSQVLHRHRQPEDFSRPSPFQGDRQQEQALHMAHAQCQPHDDAAGQH
ncbi:hypothetical protein D3C81_1159950 [compost metagenome]